MPGGLLDLFGIDPIANRNRKERLMLQELQNRGQLDLEGARGKNQIAGIEAGGKQDRLTKAEAAKFDQILQKMVTDGQLSVEQARGINAITAARVQGDEQRKSISATGTEQRKTQAEGAAQAKDLENTRSGNTKSERVQDQQLKMLSDAGVPFSPQNLEVFDQALTDPRIRNQLQAVQQLTQARQAPGYADTFAQGLQAQNLAPAFANQKTGTLSASPGELVAQPSSGISLPPTDLNQYNQMQGATENQTVDETPSPFPGLPPQLKVIRQQQPGRVRLNPKIMQQAGQINTTPQVPVSPGYSVEELLRGAGVVPSPQLY